MTAASPAPASSPAPVENPGKTLGIVGLVLSILGFNVIALIISILGLSKSKKAGQGNGFALAGIIISSLSIVVLIIVIIVTVLLGASLVGQCADLGPGVWELDNGTTITCG